MFFLHFFLFCFPFIFFVFILSPSISLSTQYNILQIIMFQSHLHQYEQKPRKLIKTDLIYDDHYNQFGGEAMEATDNVHSGIVNDSKSLPIKEEQKKNKRLFEQIIKGEKYRKVGQEGSKKNNVVEKSTMKQIKKENQKQVRKKKQSSNSNWKSFLNEEKKQNSPVSSFVGIDCEFVKCGEGESLARFSAVSEDGQVLLDTYVKPKQKITDYVTNFSGITYAHIKNAPSLEEVKKSIKKILLGKIVVGHTVRKDLEICELNAWSGIKGVIDVCQCEVYSEGGKRVALKKLSQKYLGRKIQEGWHSSVEDSQAAMSLFIKNKKQIMKENKYIN